MSEASKMPDHAVIWLQNAEDGRSQSEGRLWCEDKVWPDHPDDGEPTKYIRADIAEQMAEALELCAAALQMLPMSEHDVLKFTGKWKHYGSMRVGDILDRANAILKARQASNGDRHAGEKGE